jgi:hypothetical protein
MPAPSHRATKYVVVVNIGRLASPDIRGTLYGKDGGQLRQFVNILTVPVHPPEAYCTALSVRMVNTTSSEVCGMYRK